VIRVVVLLLIVAALAGTPAFADEDEHAVTGGAYLDTSWLNSSNNPDNRTWRTKGTSWKLDGVEIFNATAFAEKDAVAHSRWGFSAGLQTGWDVDNLAGDNATSDADWQKHLYYTYATYLFAVGRGLEVKGGLIPGNFGYEHFHAFQNPTYTREYGVDLVPYFHWGLWGTWTASETVSLGLLVVNGWNYLDKPNDVPSYGAQLIWDITANVQFKQNFYYGPEQKSTSLTHWRFVTQTMAEWTLGDFMLVGSFAWATEEVDVPGAPYDATWWWAAVWVQWRPHHRWQFTVRPEIYDDPEGVGSGAQQKLKAITVGGEFRFSPLELNTLSARLEYRFDRSTGPDGGFYEGELNTLTPDQHLVIVGLMWRFDTGN